ncbi:MAG: sugar transferase [Chloroflexi bacterium]|nr:sugar transferase [Chloroflexota bacterium]
MGPGKISRLSIQLFVLDIAVTPIGLFIASRLRLLLPYGQELSAESINLPWPVYLLAILCWSTALYLNGTYDPQRVLRWFNEVIRVGSSSLLATGLLAGALFLTYRETSRLQFLYFLIVNLLLLLGYRAILRITDNLSGRTRPGGENRVLVIGAGKLGLKVAQVIHDHSRWGFELVGFLDDDKLKQGEQYAGVQVLEKILAVRQVVEEYQIGEVWIALPVYAYDRINLVMFELEELPVRIKVIPDYFSLALVRARADVLGGIPIIGLRDPVIEGVPRIVKRIFDIIMTTLLFILLAPLMLLISIAIRLDSTGSPFFRQRRVGENGRLFDMLKFRTMTLDAEERQYEVNVENEEGEVLHKKKDDPRVTSVGRILRRTSLDELPQLINVFRGEMSLVGPRPEMPWLVDRYKSWQRKRFAVPQGITGWWQINGRSEKPMHLNPEDDLYYVYNYSLWLDIKILLRTPIAVIRGKGAF